MANNATYALGPISNGVRLNAVAVTAGATTYNPPLTMLIAAGAGTITAVMAGTGTVAIPIAANGTIADVAIYQVTTSTATGVVGFF